MISPPVFRQIEQTWLSPPARDSGLLSDVLERMVLMEQDVLGFLDPNYALTYDYGVDLPEDPPDKFPFVLHYLTTHGATLRSPLFSGNLPSHPGGIREHLYTVEIFLAVGMGNELNKDLLNATLFWLKAFDMAYSANGSLGGAVLGAKITSARAGGQNYANTDYFGWIFQVQVNVQYLMPTEAEL